MQTVCRVFAREFNGSTLSMEEHKGSGNTAGAVVTPGGALCSRVFLAGALTEVEDRKTAGVHARVADPTGTFELRTGPKRLDAAAALLAITPPAFVAVIGEAALFRTPTVTPFIRPDEITRVDRAVRDTWVIVTAANTLSRLECLKEALRGCPADPVLRAAVNHYRTTPSELRRLALAAKEALSQVREVPGGPLAASDPAVVILGLMKGLSDRKGIAVEELAALAAPLGLDERQVAKGVAQLLRDDECYQPSPGVIRLL